MSDVKHVQPVRPPYSFEDYARLISHLSEEAGSGYLVTFPDLPGVMADGESVEEALHNARDAFESAIAAVVVDMGRDIPAPTFKPDDAAAPGLSGKFVTRVPKSVHAQLARWARAEGASLNLPVLALLATRPAQRAGLMRCAAAWAAFWASAADAMQPQAVDSQNHSIVEQLR